MTKSENLCRATAWHRDTYRYTGRGESGFEMHYRQAQCKRKSKENWYCWQHQYLAETEVTQC